MTFLLRAESTHVFVHDTLDQVEALGRHRLTELVLHRSELRHVVQVELTLCLDRQMQREGLRGLSL